LTNSVSKEKFCWLPFKNKVADENLNFQRHTNLNVKSQCLVLYLRLISYIVFRRQPAEFFICKKKDQQMKAGQYKIHTTNPVKIQILDFQKLFEPIVLNCSGKASLIFEI
jgi:hypothetical protein